MTTAVDSSVLFDVLLKDSVHAAPAKLAIAGAVQAGPTVACPVVYAELATYFSVQEDLDRFLADLTIGLDPFEPAALWHASRAWKEYLRVRGRQIQCPRCSHLFQLPCPACGQPISWRQYALPDFLVAAHAIVQADRLIARDRGYYRTYFPQLRLETPVPAPGTQ